ncbi:creatine transporter-like [Dermacentor silvarum]|uniref:creatine transporter-like n=1 Tax=Dermacentor silvarum TaxID=543639 RepID=UPI0021011E5B|nr:creatine transporter-like [Dermacentor silvarum]
MLAGFGWTMLYSDVLLVLAYIPPTAFCIVYIAALFQAELPWNTCGGGEHGVEERGCYHVKHGTYPCSKVNETLARRYLARNYSGEAAIVVNGSGGQEPVSVPLREYEALRNSCVSGTVSAARAFYERHVANLDLATEGTSDSGVSLLMAMIVGWILVLLSISMGLRSIKKASALLLGVRLMLLTLLCVASCTLSGAGEGLRVLLWPQLSKVYADKTWITACQHMFYSVGISLGTVTFFASHNQFDWPILSTAWKIAIADFLFGLFTSCVAFGIYGHLANTFAVEVVDMATRGLDYVFVSFPESAEALTWPRVWMFAFYIMMAATTIGPCVGSFAGAVGSLADLHPVLAESRTLWAIVSCSIACAFSLPLAMRIAASAQLHFALESAQIIASAYVITWPQANCVQEVLPSAVFRRHCSITG